MNDGKGVRVGVIGCGYWGSKHVRVLHGTPGVEGLVLIDGLEERLHAVGRLYPSAQRFGRLDEALPHLDALVVATPPSTHVPLALRALNEGKHVLVEKPLAPTARDAETLLEAAEEAGTVLMAGHTFEYNPAVWKLRELIHGQELGDVYYFDSARLSLGLYQNDVNVIMDLAPHDISIANHVLGVRPVAIQAWAARHADPRFEDVAYLRLFYEDSQVSATIHVSWLDPCKVRRVTVVGSEKMAVYDDLAAEERVRIIDKGVYGTRPTPADGDPDLTRPTFSYRYGDIVAPFIAPDEPLAIQDRHFVECAALDLTPMTDGANGLAVVRVLEAAQMSLKLARPVAIEGWWSDAAVLAKSSAGVEEAATRIAGREVSPICPSVNPNGSHAVA